MELYIELLSGVLQKELTNITFPDLYLDAKQIVEMQCYKALKEIKTIIEDDSLEDERCFSRIEAIVRTLEKIGSDGGGRHDF